MKLKRVIKGVDVVKINGDTERDITRVIFDSREVTPGDLFVAVKGSSSDGHIYIDKAIGSGAAAIVYEKGLFDLSSLDAGSESAVFVEVEDSHIALGQIASAYYDDPSAKLKLVGITGTNGKTTTVTLLHRLFTSLGYKCGLISTIENRVGEIKSDATHTTPDPVRINSLINEMSEAGCEFCFMEVSSHSLDQKRVAGLQFTGAIFSNITHDHLDYHKTFLEYIRVKKSFFDTLPADAFALTNLDDKNGEVMVQNCKAKIYKYSCLSPADFNCRIVEKGLDGMLIKIDNQELWSRFIGVHNAYNLLAVYAAATLLGAKKEEVLVAISALESVSGRLEYIKGGENITAVVDYAHTPDALENVLKTLKDCAGDSEIITVFGCGGNRDKTKRPEMAAVSANYSDRVVVTSDNPRFEEPESIIEDIKQGFDRSQLSRVLFITDRREAIRTSVALAKPGSIILVAGKGHENYQDVKGVKHHFDDKEILNEVFNM
ncbi:MAG: UDP-N-acetylmuramoyl-L-alanyl-D-glutamate--2,6-diaminopimelate ligase [Bacteroidales bacterium]